MPVFQGNEKLYATQLLCLINAHALGLSDAERMSLPQMDAGSDTNVRNICPDKSFTTFMPFAYCSGTHRFYYDARPGETRKEFELLGQATMFIIAEDNFGLYMLARSDVAAHVHNLGCVAVLVDEGLMRDGITSKVY